MLTVNVNKMSPTLELARISNHALKRMMEANSWKNRSTLNQPNEINHVV